MKICDYIVKLWLLILQIQHALQFCSTHIWEININDQCSGVVTSVLSVWMRTACWVIVVFLSACHAMPGLVLPVLVFSFPQSSDGPHSWLTPAQCSSLRHTEYTNQLPPEPGQCAELAATQVISRRLYPRYKKGVGTHSSCVFVFNVTNCFVVCCYWSIYTEQNWHKSQCDC